MSDIAKGPRIALVGSCQVVGIRAALLKLCPDSEVKAWHIGASKETNEDIAAQIGQYDLIVSQLRQPDQNAPLALQRLQEAHKQVFYVPTLVFNGFHPDCIYLRVQNKLLGGPLQSLHSAIIASAYVLKVPQQRVFRLFNSLTYGSLGYFEAFDAARDSMLQSYAAAGFDLAPYVNTWKSASGSFMHTVNHPHIQVLTRLAHMISVRAGFIDAMMEPSDGVVDALAAGIRWPVYPEIARRLGLPKENVVFKRGQLDIDLASAIERFYKFYQDVDCGDMRAALPTRLIEDLEKILAT